MKKCEDVLTEMKPREGSSDQILEDMHVLCLSTRNNYGSTMFRIETYLFSFRVSLELRGLFRSFDDVVAKLLL